MYAKGQSGNPGGKHKEKLFFEALMLAIKDCEDRRGLRTIAGKLLDLAASGDMQAIKEVANRIDGMPMQQVEIDQTVTNSWIGDPPMTTEKWAGQYSGNGAQKPN